MSGGPASRSRGAPLILMLKRLQHLGSLRLVVRSLASCCALLGGLCGARWLLACSDAVGKIRPSRCSYGSQGIVEPYSIPEQSSARKGENSTSLVGYSAPSFPGIVNSSGMIQNQQACLPESICRAVAAVESQALFVLPSRSSFLANSFNCGF